MISSNSERENIARIIAGWEVMVRGLCFLVAVTLWIVPHVGRAQTLPSEVLDEVGELDGVCSDHGGKPGQPNWVEHAVIGPDQLEVWVLDEGRYNCEGGALWPGHRGSGISIYGRLPSGKIKKVFAVTALEMSIQSAGSAPRIWIHGWGETCGLPEPETDEEWATRKTCQRPLNWDGKSQKMVFAPMSEVQLK